MVHRSQAPQGRPRHFQSCEALQWEKSRLSHQLTRMAKRGLWSARTAQRPRAAFAVLTPTGRATIEASAPGHVEDVRRYALDTLSAGQLETLADIAEAVLTRLGTARQEGLEPSVRGRWS